MAYYPNITTTLQGLDSISAANAASKAIIFTRVVFGDGAVPDGTSIESMTDMVSAKMELSVTDAENQGNGQYSIYATISNGDLETGFRATEIGVYAKVDGDESDKLFAYTNGGAYGEYIPSKSIPVKAQNIQVDVSIGNAETVNITLKDDTYVTVNALNRHNTSETAHENRLIVATTANKPTSMADKGIWVEILED